MPAPPQPKDVIKASISLPVLIEATLPAGAPPFSSSLSALAESIPEIPAPPLPAAIPGLPALPKGVAGMPGADFLKSLQVSLPNGGPRLPQTAKPTVGIDTGSAPKPAAQVFKIGL